MTELGFIEKFLEENMAYARDKFAAREAITVTSKRDANDLLTEVDLTLQSAPSIRSIASSREII